MAIVRDRHSPVRLFGRRLLTLGLLVLVIVAISWVWNAYRKERESHELRAEAQGQLSDFSTRQPQPNADIATLESDRGKEEALRDQYALAKRGEGVIIIIDPSNGKPIEATSTFLQWFQQAFSWW